MIIVTGLDNTGKTSLVNHISDKFNIPIAERYPCLPPTDGNDWFNWVREQFEWPYPSFNSERVYDRLFIDEFVYGPVLRKKYICSMEQMATLSSILLMKQPLIIYTCIDPDKIEATFSERKQYPDVKDIRKLLSKYKHVLGSWPMNQLRNFAKFNYMNDPDYKRVDYTILNYLGGSI